MFCTTILCIIGCILSPIETTYFNSDASSCNIRQLNGWTYVHTHKKNVFSSIYKMVTYTEWNNLISVAMNFTFQSVWFQYVALYRYKRILYVHHDNNVLYVTCVECISETTIKVVPYYRTYTGMLSFIYEGVAIWSQSNAIWCGNKMSLNIEFDHNAFFITIWLPNQ